VPDNSTSLPDFTRWPSFPFEGDMRVKALADPVKVEPPRSGEDASDCVACNTPDDSYIWVSERWRVRAMDRPTGLPMVLILECRSHLDLGDLPNLLAAELGVMTVRLERAIRSLDDVARVHVNRWGDGSAHLHMWFLARPYGRLQLRGTFLSLWDDILPVIPEQQWRENLALVAAWLAEFGGRANAEPPHIQWQSPSKISESPSATSDTETDTEADTGESATGASGTTNAWRPTDLADVRAEGSQADMPAYAAEPSTEDLSGEAAVDVQTASPEETDQRSAVNANEPTLDDADADVDADQPAAPAPSDAAPVDGSRPVDSAAPVDGTRPVDGAASVGGARPVGEGPPLDPPPVESAKGWTAGGERPPMQRDPAEAERKPNEAANAS